MNNLQNIVHDPVTLVLLGTLVLLTLPPVILITVWRVTWLPFQAGSLRWVLLGWALLLAAASVWNLSRQVRFSAEQAGADNYTRLTFLALGVLVILFVAARHRFAFLQELVGGVLGFFFAFALWGLASTQWSVSPAGTLYKSLEYATMIVLFALTASLIKTIVKGPQNRLLALKNLFDFNWFLLFLLLTSVYVGLLVWPETAIERNISMFGFSIKGALPGIASNGVGQLGAILAVVALVRLLHKPGSRAIYIPLLAVSLLTLVLAQSRSPILAFLAAIIVVLVASRRFGLLLVLSGGLVSAMLLPGGYGHTIYEFLRRGQDEGNLKTLSGRTEYWELSLEALRDNWLTGLGANAGGRNVLHAGLGEEVSTVHNVYVEALLDLGVVGLAFLLAGLIVAWFWLFRLRPYVTRNPISRLLWIEALGVFTILSVRSMFSITFVWSWMVITFGVILVFIIVMRREVVHGRYAGAPVAQPVPASRWRRSSIRG
jgi:O-antigen ligase